MTQQALEIQWVYGIEFIRLSDITGAPQRITTLERWREDAGNQIVSYVANVEAFSKRRAEITLRLRYEREDQHDSRVTNDENGVRWGTSTITWDTSGLTASAEWADAEGSKDWSGPAQKVTVLGGQSPVDDSKRQSGSVIVKLRPKQREMRYRLLFMDKCCVLSAESEEATLDAAHIIPVQLGGREKVENAILLRADLHRLFDSGLFSFEVSGDAAFVRHSKTLSDDYVKILAGKKLSGLTFDRVARALPRHASSPAIPGRSRTPTR